MDPVDVAVVTSSAVVVLGGVAGWLRWGRPKWRRFWTRLDGTLDAINGRESYVDAASGRNVPALAPLTTRVANVEEAIILLTRIEDRVTHLESRVDAMETAAVERIVTKAESAQMWRAMADGDPDLDPDKPE